MIKDIVSVLTNEDTDKEYSLTQMAWAVYMDDPDYFETVDFEYLKEAVENTKNETGMTMAEYNKAAYTKYIEEYLI